MGIFGLGSDWVGPITALEQDMRRQEERIDPGSTPVDNIWPEENLCWGDLVGAGISS